MPPVGEGESLGAFLVRVRAALGLDGYRDAARWAMTHHGAWRSLERGDYATWGSYREALVRRIADKLGHDPERLVVLGRSVALGYAPGTGVPHRRYAAHPWKPSGRHDQLRDPDYRPSYAGMLRAPRTDYGRGGVRDRALLAEARAELAAWDDERALRKITVGRYAS